ncbi:hypothetical protein NDU88_007788 [Pleurodeles waltl]|uniref:Uncharacterized protein n=1 Tax=Pleurodeles waltl TaxID=8319 RepID=A0AAV7VRF2_PLEWA|nr:hypothetical protein NDU88_007788 [Pleurodeles waltl]
MSHKVQEWEVENPTIFKAGEQVEFMDSSGVVMRGTVFGEVSGNDNVGMAQVRLDFWEPGYGASQSGCDSTHALGGREEQFSTRRLGRWACDKRLLVRVGAPSGHRLEERARPREVCLTSGEASGPGFGFQEVYPVAEGEPYTSRGAGFAELEHIEEEFLDDEDEEEAEEVERSHWRTVQKEDTLDVSHEATKNAVQINRPVGGHHQVFVTENLPRGYTSDTLPRLLFFVGQPGFVDASGNWEVFRSSLMA